MKITHLIWSFNIGGAEKMLVDIINQQKEYAKINLIIINDAYNKNLIDNITSDIQIYKLNRTCKSKNPIFILKLWSLLLYSKPDIIHCHDVNLANILPFFRKKSVVTVHDVRHKTDSLHLYKKVFAISKTVQNYILKESKVQAELIYNGINVNHIKKKLDYNYSTFRIVQISRLIHTKKGQHILIDSINYLVNELNITNISIDFIGDGPSYSLLLEQTKKLSIDKYFSFLGEVDTNYIQENINQYNLLVQPSIYEGFGLTVAEAILAGVPVLVSDTEGPMEIINNGEFGLCFKSEDYIDCAHQIANIIKNYQILTSPSSIQKGIIHIESNYNIKTTSINYLKHY